MESAESEFLINEEICGYLSFLLAAMIYWNNNLLSSHSLVNVLNFTSVSGLQNEFIHTVTLVVLYEHEHKLDLADIVASAQLCSQFFHT